jgi:hypothetical protein
MVGFVSETVIACHHSSVVVQAGGGDSLRVGDRMPNPDIRWNGRNLRLLDGLKTKKHLVVGFEVNNQPRVRDIVPQAESLFLHAAELETGKEGVVELLGERDGLAVIRPDGYVGFRGSSAKLDRLPDYSRKVGLTGNTSRSAAY